jgi:hypothetical protein
MGLNLPTSLEFIGDHRVRRHPERGDLGQDETSGPTPTLFSSVRHRAEGNTPVIQQGSVF